jgi:predicted GIY-YIG superfamily endonuclease
MVYWVYLFACYKDRKLICYYAGQTNNIERREKEHIQNVIERDTRHFTGRFDYVKLVWKYEVNSRSEAVQLEQAIKGLSFDDKNDLASGELDVEDLFNIEDDDF